MLNMLNVHTTERITAGTSAGLSAGSVMLVNCCQRDAPSTRAASYSSPGMDCNAPSETTIMNGKESHPLVASAVRKDVPGEANHDTGCPPKSCITWFTTPNCWWNIPFQISAVM